MLNSKEADVQKHSAPRPAAISLPVGVLLDETLHSSRNTAAEVAQNNTSITIVSTICH